MDDSEYYEKGLYCPECPGRLYRSKEGTRHYPHGNKECFRKLRAWNRAK